MIARLSCFRLTITPGPIPLAKEKGREARPSSTINF
jgi:hypothetical protein